MDFSSSPEPWAPLVYTSGQRFSWGPQAIDLPAVHRAFDASSPDGLRASGNASIIGLSERPGEQIMATITYDISPSAFAALHLAPQEFAREMRVAACVQWYAQGLVSQERAAEIAGLSRVEFIEELFRRRVPACQVTLEELIEEMEHE